MNPEETKTDSRKQPPPTPQRKPGQAMFEPGYLLGGRYQMLRLLGRGGMGEVWAAYDARLKVEVALKFVHSTSSHDKLELLRHEVLAARQVVSPNVCRIFDLVELEGYQFVSMELVDGSSLRGFLKERGPLPLQEATGIAVQMLDGLAAIHKAGLIHRDLKPENLMLTRSGRVVIMDFGLAASHTDVELLPGAGTLSYMSPEQMERSPLDERSDLYTAGLILAELLADVHRGDPVEWREFMFSLRMPDPEAPPKPGPWSLILSRMLSWERSERLESAQALSRALEEVTLRVEGAENQRPYPGLAAFTAEDTRHFFGREAPIETLWKRLQRQSLLALIGPSGAGKSSFLRAGLLPARPAGWGTAIFKPGADPFYALAQALEARPQEAPSAALARFRAEHGEALLVIDQFEELFTRNDEAVGARFAALLGEAAGQLGVRVLLSMRDDFLFQCQAYEALEPVFSELTPLRPLTGEALRRALVQPALRLGYRFEDEALVETMLQLVERERGALPLLAFAAARLWDLRDRDRGLLTWEAYRSIGGVEGALAQHAEGLLLQLGPEREELIRELFRNLITAQGTRATRSAAELLTVFGERREEAEEALSRLIEGRLLTVYGEGGSREVEIIHESLLAAWPRLVQWRVQDTEGALLREHLRQAAQVWNDRGRPADLLWSGPSLQEFLVWRRRYPGGLGSLEQAFVGAMLRLANRRALRRRVGVGLAFCSMGVILAIVLGLYLQARSSNWRATEAEQRARASQLLALGRLRLESQPSAALAFARASLELADSPAGRRFALESIAAGPSVLRLRVPNESLGSPAFSPDGSRLLIASEEGHAWIWSSRGGKPEQLALKGASYAEWGEDGKSLFLDGQLNLERWSLAERKVLWSTELAGLGWWSASENGSIYGIGQEEENTVFWQISMKDGSSRELARLPGAPDDLRLAVESQGRFLAAGLGQTVGLLEFDAKGKPQWRELGQHEEPVWALALDPEGKTLASGDISGALRIWDLATGLDWSLTGHPSSVMDARWSPDGKWLATASSDGTVRLWRPNEPAVPEPLILREGRVIQVNHLAFDPSSRWLAATWAEPTGSGAGVWAIPEEAPRVFKGHVDAVQGLAFDPAGQWLASSGWDGAIWLWSLSKEVETRLVQDVKGTYWTLDVDPSGKTLVVGEDLGQVSLVPLDGAEPKRLEGFETAVISVEFRPDGKVVAGAGVTDDPQDAVLRLWNLETGEAATLSPNDGKGINSVSFDRKGERLLTSSGSGVRLWDVQRGTFQLLSKQDTDLALFTEDESSTLRLGKGEASTLSLSGGERRTFPELGKALNDMALGHGLLASGDTDGLVRVGPAGGGEPHLLYGHRGAVNGVDLSPDGRWLASGGVDQTVRLWPVPTGPPPQTLPLPAFLEGLDSFTNLRVEPEPLEPSEWRVVIEGFPGWNRAPSFAAKPTTKSNSSDPRVQLE